jgi:hypothetical protein
MIWKTYLDKKLVVLSSGSSYKVNDNTDRKIEMNDVCITLPQSQSQSQSQSANKFVVIHVLDRITVLHCLRYYVYGYNMNSNVNVNEKRACWISHGLMTSHLLFLDRIRRYNIIFGGSVISLT